MSFICKSPKFTSLNLTLIEDITQKISFQDIVKENLQGNPKLVYCEDCRYRTRPYLFLFHNTSFCAKSTIYRDPIKKTRVVYRHCENENKSNACDKYAIRIDWRYRVKQWIRSWF